MCRLWKPPRGRGPDVSKRSICMSPFAGLTFSAMSDVNMPNRRDKLVVEGIDPKSGKRLAITISQTKLLAVSKRSRGQILEAAYTVVEALQRPCAVFEGLLREDDEPRTAYAWRCYCVIPPLAYRQDGEVVDSWPGEVFLVFVDDECVAYNWYWVEADPDDACLPVDYHARFRERLL